MKTAKKVFTSRHVSVVMALVLLFTAFASVGAVKVEAVATDGGDGITDVLYFFDYYPEIGYTQLSNSNPDLDIVYDRSTESAGMIYTRLASNNYDYFSTLSSECTVVLDFKRFKPDENFLINLFAHLKNSFGFKTVFVTDLNQADFDTADLFDNVDIFYQSNHDRLRTFIENLILDLDESNCGIEGTNIVLDGIALEIDTYPDLPDLLNNSVFLQILLEELCDAVGYTGLYNYSTMIADLSTLYNINIYAHENNYQYKKIYPMSTVNASSLTDFDAGSDPLNPNNVCVIGFYKLNTTFSTFLYRESPDGEYPIYLLEADPFVFDEDGLSVITDVGLEGKWNNCDSEDEFQEVAF